MLSTAYQWLERHDDAVREAKISVRLNPNDAIALHALGNKSDLVGDPDAIALMEKAQRLNPQDAQLHTNLVFLARAYLSAGAYEEALDRARTAIERKPDFPNAYYVMAIALAQLGRTDEAKAALAKCDDLHEGFVASRGRWSPYVDPEKNESIWDGLRKLGIATGEN